MEGKVIQVLGPVIDVEFDGDKVPEINEALIVEFEAEGKKRKDVLEVAAQIGDNIVRTIAMDLTDGLQRGTKVIATGGPIKVPVGEAVLGRIFNVTGDPIDEGEPIPADVPRWSIHRDPPPFEEQSTKMEVFETGIKVVDLLCPDMKGATTTMSHDARDTADSMKDGAVETSKSGERTITNVSSDAKDSAVKVSDDLKSSEIATVKSSETSTTSLSRDVRDSTIELAEDSKDSITNTSKDLKDSSSMATKDFKDSTVSVSHDMTDSTKTVSHDLRDSTDSVSDNANDSTKTVSHDLRDSTNSVSDNANDSTKSISSSAKRKSEYSEYKNFKSNK